MKKKEKQKVLVGWLVGRRAKKEKGKESMWWFVPCLPFALLFYSGRSRGVDICHTGHIGYPLVTLTATHALSPSAHYHTYLLSHHDDCCATYHRLGLKGVPTQGAWLRKRAGDILMTKAIRRVNWHNWHFFTTLLCPSQSHQARLSKAARKKKGMFVLFTRKERKCCNCLTLLLIDDDDRHG